MDRSSGLMVCPISGAMADRMMTECEEEAEEGGEARCMEGLMEDDFGGEGGGE